MPALRFSQDVVEAAWQRSGQTCECMEMAHCRHPTVPHRRLLAFAARGKDDSPQGWELHHVDPRGLPTLNNSRVLCIECHKKTPSYGTGEVQPMVSTGTAFTVKSS